MALHIDVLGNIRPPHFPTQLERQQASLKMIGDVLGIQQQQLGIQQAQRQMAEQAAMGQILIKHGGINEEALAEIAAQAPSHYPTALDHWEKQKEAQSRADIATLGVLEKNPPTVPEIPVGLPTTAPAEFKGAPIPSNLEGTEYRPTESPNMTYTEPAPTLPSPALSMQGNIVMTPEEGRSVLVPPPNLILRGGPYQPDIPVPFPSKQQKEFEKRQAEQEKIRVAIASQAAPADIQEYRLWASQQPPGQNSSYEAFLKVKQRTAQPSEFEATYQDFLKDPALVKKYGSSRIGFDRYKQDQRIAQAIASRQPPQGGLEEKIVRDRMTRTGESMEDAYAAVKKEASQGEAAAGRKEVMTAYNSLNDAKLRMAAMEDAAKRAATSPNPGASDMVLLSNHIGMTFGNVKGARTGRDLIEAHLAARSLPERLAVIAGGVLNGQRLSQEQRREFLGAARARLAEVQKAYDDAKQVWGYAPPGETGAPVPSTGGTAIKPGGAVERLLNR